MVSTLALVASLSVASAALTVYSPRTNPRHTLRPPNLQSQPFSPVGAPAGYVANVEYNSNWSGAVCVGPEGGFTSVTGTFTVPTPLGSDASGAAIWVGINGYTCDNAVLQTGIEFIIIDDGSVEYNAWYEWYPDYAYVFSGSRISAGDVVRATVITSSATSGTAIIENLTTGQTVLQDLSSDYALCRENAEWIVEDFEENDSLMIIHFGNATFTDATATGPSGIICTP